jgi:hypothetical protein
MNKSLCGIIRRSAFVAAAALAAIAMISCYPNSPTDAEEFDVVVTFYDEGADFTAISTFGMPDSIATLEISGGENIEPSHDFDEDILDHIREKLTAAGYTYEPDPGTNAPDFVVLVGSAATTEYDPYADNPWFSYWSWWDGWDSFPNVQVSWGVDYSWYSGAVVYSYDVGSLIILLVNADDFDQTGDNRDIKPMWLGTMNGILSGADITMFNRVTAGIDKMFEQSPYLSKSGQ